MRALHDLVQSGKVRYIGASSMWTWEFATYQFVAERNGWTKFVAMQNKFSALVGHPFGSRVRGLLLNLNATCPVPRGRSWSQSRLKRVRLNLTRSETARDDSILQRDWHRLSPLVLPQRKLCFRSSLASSESFTVRTSGTTSLSTRSKHS